MAVKVFLLLALLLKLAIGDVCNECFECDAGDAGYDPTIKVCCDCGPDDTTKTPTMTPSESTGAPSVTPQGSTRTPTDATGAPTPSTTVEPVSCAHWTSSRADMFGGTGGAPLNVCIAKWGGSQQSSESFMYKCSDDHKTILYWKWLQTTECDEGDTSTATALPFVFDPDLDTDSYNCAGDPCDYYIIEDGTSHPDQTCPYDIGIEYNTGKNDYATWEHKLVLQGCQTFNGLTSQYAKCNEDDGISVYQYTDPYCQGTSVKSNYGATLQCNYGTGTSVYCFDDRTTEEPESTILTTRDPDDTSPTDDPDDMTSTEEKHPQHCSWGNCPSSGGRYKPSQFIAVCMIFMVGIWFKL